MKNLDDKDKRILEMLIEDSRRPYREIADEVGLSESTVRKRVIKLQKERVIEKFTIDLSLEDQTGICAFLTVVPKPDSNVKEILREMYVLPQCQEVYSLIECGVLIKVLVPTVIELDALIESFKGRTDVKNVEKVCVVLKIIKKKTTSTFI